MVLALLVIAILILGVARIGIARDLDVTKAKILFVIGVLFALASVFAAYIQDNQEEDRCRDLGGYMHNGTCYESELPKKLF